MKKNNNLVIKSVDKGEGGGGGSMVVTDSVPDRKLALDILQNERTYRVLPKDPTIQILQKITTAVRGRPGSGGYLY